MQHRVGNFPISFVVAHREEMITADCHTLGDMYCSESVTNKIPAKTKWREDVALSYELLLKNDPIAMAFIHGDYHEPPIQFYIDKIVEEHFMFRHMVLSHRDTSWKFGDANNIDFMETLIKLMREYHRQDYFSNFTYNNILEGTTEDAIWRIEQVSRSAMVRRF